ncbi:MAG: hypothetical protein ACOC80_12590 [Petrotogales bacterium]
MPKTTKTTINVNKEGQHTVTIPKPIAEAMDLAGKKVQWKVKSGKALELRVLEEE